MAESRDIQVGGVELLPIGDAARLLGVSVDTVPAVGARRRIEGRRTVGGQRRFPRDEIDRLLEAA
ncbi:MAG: excisionase family DNA-binding protein [Thermomicrobiales bacterium]